MKITTMRSLFVLLLACLLLAGTAAAFTNITAADSIYYKEMGGPSCADASVPGLKGESLIGVVELSGHSDVLIDGKKVEPDGTGTYQEHPVNYYRAGPGTHQIFITQPGYTNYFASRSVCSGKVTYAFYDQEAHLFQGTTRTAAMTTTVSAITTTAAVQTADYGSLKSALGASGSSEYPGSLSVTTDPAGATISIDGVRLGISPATIPGLSPGSHTLLLKLDGYDDLSLPITISAGKTQNYSSALMKSSSPGTAAAVPTTKKSSAPGVAGIIAACVTGALLLIRKTGP